MNFFQRSTIRTKLLLIMLVAAVPIMLAVCLQLISLYRTEYRESEQAIQTAVQSIAQQHAAHIEGIETLLVALSSMQEVRSKDRAACTRLFQGILGQNPAGRTIGLADSAGNLVASGSAAPVDFGNRRFFRETLRRKRFSAGEYTASGTEGMQSVHFALPVLDDNADLVVVLFASLDFDRFHGMYDAQGLPPGSSLTIADHRGVIIHRYPAHAAIKPGQQDRPALWGRMTGPQSEGAFSEIGADGAKRIYAFKRLKLQPDDAPFLYIRVSVPEREALSTTRHYFFYSGALFGLAALIALLCSHSLAGRYLISPIERLATVLRTVKEGDFSVRTGMPYAPNELGMLARLFDSLAESLEARLRERDRAEAGLRASEHKFSAVFDRSPVTMALTSYPQGTFIEVNRVFTRMFGYSRDEAVGMTALELGIWLSQEDRSSYVRLLSSERTVHNFETGMRRKDGTLIDVLFAGDIMAIDGKQCVLNVVQDITAQKRMEQVLRESERRFRELLENIHMVAITLDRAGNITFCNDFLLTLTGWSREEVFGQNWFDLFIPQEVSDQVESMFREALATAALPFHYENPIKTREGEQRTIVWYNTLLRDSDGSIEGVASLGMDMTDYRNIEAQLQQSRKMEAVGQLAGGVAHDFNNLLTPIMGYAELIRNELSAVGGKVERVDSILQAAMKARDLTRQLLSFGRKQTLDMRVIDLNRVISRFADILRRTIRENIEIRLNLSTDAAALRADRTQIEQIIMNLVVNAQDAIPGNGTITIETAPITLDEEYVRQHPETKPGEYVMLAVSDTGCGIAPESLDHIFEPFFTTKSVEKGTGLGLATVYGIVKQHGGNIWVYSEPGRGTVFKLYFPRVSEGNIQSEALAAAPLVREGTSGTILLVEDNPMVREMVRDVLLNSGYGVLEAANPPHALELALANPVDLLVSDVVMPALSGPELYARLLEHQPLVKALFMSGYTFNVVAQWPLVGSGDNYLQKPFTVVAFLNKVASILNADRHA